MRRILETEGISIRLGRDPACEIPVDAARCKMVSALHARIDAEDGKFVVVHLSRNNRTLLNDAVVATQGRIQAGDRLRLGLTGPTIEFFSIEPMPRASADGSGTTVQADARHLAMIRGTLGTQRFELGSGGVIGRDSAACSSCSIIRTSRDSTRSSRWPAKRSSSATWKAPTGRSSTAAGSKKPKTLQPGDRIDIGPFSLGFDGTGLVSRSRSNNIELSALELKRVVVDRATGQPLTLLKDITLIIRPREFVCLLGPSGSGKSTLLTMLSGRNAPDGGTVGVNGEDLYADFEALKGDIAVVPQKDVLHNSLAVGAALRYTAELRLPADTSRDELESSVSDILEVVGLTERRTTLIRHLSGGQVKRASLANELMARPSLLFLDEVTSGLDEQTDREVMELFRQVADGGKTVVCVTHSLANVESKCHLVVILTRGGRLAFFGTPDEAKEYFGIGGWAMCT